MGLLRILLAQVAARVEQLGGWDRSDPLLQQLQIDVAQLLCAALRDVVPDLTWVRRDEGGVELVSPSHEVAYLLRNPDVPVTSYLEMLLIEQTADEPVSCPVKAPHVYLSPDEWDRAVNIVKRLLDKPEAWE